MTNEIVKSQFDYYRKNQDEIVRQYDGKALVIKNFRVEAAFDTIGEAYLFAKANFEPGTFLIQKCSPGDKDYSAAFHSRVSIRA